MKFEFVQKFPKRVLRFQAFEAFTNSGFLRLTEGSTRRR